MNSNSIQENDLTFLLNKYNIDKNKYIVPISDFIYYNIDNIVNNDNLFDFQCAICLNILKEPKSCSSNKISHSFCKDCIDIYLKENNKCPLCKNIFEYKTNDEIYKLLNTLQFKCLFNKKGCKEIINYYEYFNHIYECKYKNITYECNILKFNYQNKNLGRCNYKGDIKKIENHFKLCAFLKYKCIFCDENILRIKLKEHVENKCKIGIINYENGNKYIGEKKNRIKEGYGIYYYSNGDKYEGEWKNDKCNGYGILYLLNGNKYEGEWKNDKYNGYGSFYMSNGNKYEGELLNNNCNGYGIFYLSNGDKYEGEWKDNKLEGYGIYYCSNGDKYNGEFKDNKLNGYGIYYYSNGGKYEGEWKNDKPDGYGILYYSNGDKYEVEWKIGN